MKIFAIYSSADADEPFVRTLAEDPAQAVEKVMENGWCSQQMTESAYAELVEELS